MQQSRRSTASIAISILQPKCVPRLFRRAENDTCQGRPRLKKAIANAYSPFFGRPIDPEIEVTITTGANEGNMHF
jgi:aspartate/methionine/tyrosine aminotransferase